MIAPHANMRVIGGEAPVRRSPLPSDYEEREVTFTDPGVPCGTVATWMRKTEPTQSVTIEEATFGFPFALPACAAIEQAAALMAYEGVTCIAIVGEHGRVVGLLSALDLARALAVVAGYAICA